MLFRSLKRRPDLVRVAAEPYYRDRRDEVPPGMAPYYKVPIFNYHRGYFSANVEPTYIGSAHRFEECGEMNPAQLRETTMDPDSRRLIKLSLDAGKKTDTMLDLLLARKRAPDRKDWLGKRGDQAEVA